jgi:hypothetical protein
MITPFFSPHPPVNINNVQIRQTEEVMYLGLHLDRRLTWHKHIFTKRKQLGINLTKMYWLLGHKSNLSTANKLLIYKTILEPIWTYRIQLWGTTSTSNIEILPIEVSTHDKGRTSYVPNTIIQKDLQIPTVRNEIGRYSKRLNVHPNELILNLKEPTETRRLRRHLPIHLPTRFNM